MSNCNSYNNNRFFNLRTSLDFNFIVDYYDETINVPDNYAIDFSKPLSHIILPEDQYYIDFIKVPDNDNQLITDSSYWLFTKPITDSNSISDNYVLQFTNNTVDLVSILDPLAILFSMPIISTLSWLDSQIINVTKPIDDTYTINDDKYINFNTLYVDYGTVLDSYNIDFIRPVDIDYITLSDNNLLNTTLNITDSQIVSTYLYYLFTVSASSNTATSDTYYINFSKSLIDSTNYIYNNSFDIYLNDYIDTTYFVPIYVGTRLYTETTKFFTDSYVFNDSSIFNNDKYIEDICNLIDTDIYDAYLELGYFSEVYCGNDLH